jgi:hypothetical protein
MMRANGALIDAANRRVRRRRFARPSQRHVRENRPAPLVDVRVAVALVVRDLDVVPPGAAAAGGRVRARADAGAANTVAARAALADSGGGCARVTS